MRNDKTKKYLKTTILEFLKEQNENNEYYDLFEHYDKQPNELSIIVKKYLDELEEAATDKYQIIRRFHDDVYKIGYTFDSGLDAEPYGLRPIGVKLNQLKGWEGEDN